MKAMDGRPKELQAFSSERYCRAIRQAQATRKCLHPSPDPIELRCHCGCEGTKPFLPPEYFVGDLSLKWHSTLAPIMRDKTVKLHTSYFPDDEASGNMLQITRTRRPQEVRGNTPRLRMDKLALFHIYD
jgi:hypothetical protein